MGVKAFCLSKALSGEFFPVFVKGLSGDARFRPRQFRGKFDIHVLFLPPPSQIALSGKMPAGQSAIVAGGIAGGVNHAINQKGRAGSVLQSAPKGLLARGNSARRPVSRVLSAPRGRGTAIPLGRVSQRASRDQPGRRNEDVPCIACRNRQGCGRPYSVLLPVGFTLPPLSPGARCALAAPFRPCPRDFAVLHGRFDFCGTFPEVALAGR